MPTMDRKLIGADSKEIKLPKSGRVSLAIPIEMENDTLDKWKKYITDNHIAQPLTQMFVKAYTVNKNVLETRYEGLRALYSHVKKLEKEGEVSYSEGAELYGITVGFDIAHDDNWGGD